MFFLNRNWNLFEQYKLLSKFIQKEPELFDMLGCVASLMFCLFVFIVSAKVQSPRAFPARRCVSEFCLCA